MKNILLVVMILLVICAGAVLLIHDRITESQDEAPQAQYADQNVQQSAPSGSDELPPCPSETATGCKKVEKSRQNQVQGCTGEGPVELASPMKYEDIGIIIPMGAMIGGHVTPIDHMYFQPVVFHSPPDSYDVLADADGVITSIGLEGPPAADNENIKSYNKYRIVIHHTCDFYSIYNLVTSLSPRIQSITGEIKPGSNYRGKPIAVQKGELMGRIGGQTLDLSVNYDKVTLTGLLNSESYEREPWKIHTVDPFDYWEPQVREQLMKKNVRSVAPFGGKIDYDQDGKLVGNWFVENTNGYQGVNPAAYWGTHLAFAYDPIDPSLVILSLGNFAGEAKQFAVKGNSPDPAQVTLQTGLVKYELVDFGYTSNGEFWDRMSMASDIKAIGHDQVMGTVLVQLIEGRKAKVEAFPGKKASEVQAFTEGAKIYVR